MTTLYYIDAAGAAQQADLGIIVDCINIAGDVLGNMSITADGTGIHATPDWDEDCATDLQRAALAAGARWYADSADDAQWWIEYVDGCNATQSDIEDLRDELDDMSDEDVSAVARTVGADDRIISQGYPVQAIIEWLSGDTVGYAGERAAFEARLVELRAALPPSVWMIEQETEGQWEPVQGGDFASEADADAGLRSLVDVSGFGPARLRVVEYTGAKADAYRS